MSRHGHCARSALLAVAALALAAPGDVRAAMGNTPPAITTLSVSPSPVPALGTAQVTCSAIDGAGVASLALSVTGGALAGGATDETRPVSGTAATATFGWATPAPGSYTITCTATDTGGAFGGPATASVVLAVDVVAASDAPSVALDASATDVRVGSAVTLTATTSGDGLAPAWSATGGTLEPSGAASARWFAPAIPGAYDVSLAVTDALGRTASATVTILVRWADVAQPYRAEGGPPLFPSRIAVGAGGAAYVTDPRARAVVVFDAAGTVERRIALPGTPSGVALSAGGLLYVGDLDARSVDVYLPTGRRVGALGAGPGAFEGPVAITVHPASGRIYVADAPAARVLVFEPDGTAVASFPAGTRPAGLALDPARDRLYVADAAAGQLLVLGLDGTPQSTVGTFGGALTRPAGVAVGPDGSVYVVDSFQSRVAVLSPDGGLVGYLGKYGEEAGELVIPFDVAIDPGGRVLVTNTQLARLEVFAVSGGGAGCASDVDCDGLPDGWELANGLDPESGADAGLDADGDGLTAVQELWAATDPTRADTDGDGVADGAELQSGLDPTVADRPALAAGSARESGPGLVRLSAALRASIPCTVSWRQSGGPAVALRGASTLSPAFVAREPGEYRVAGVARCGAVESAAVEAVARVRNVPPLVDAGRPLVVLAGQTFTLDGLGTSDANGDTLTFRWSQTLGAPLTGGAESPLLALRVPPGLLAFELEADDGRGASGSAEVQVVAVAGATQTPTAMAVSPVVGEAGAAVALDASASVALGSGFAWTQVAGPAATLAGAGAPVASFVPPAPGRYGFEVRLLSRWGALPPGRVDVFVAAAGRSLPVARTAARLDARVGEPVLLDGAASVAGAGATWRWRPLAGPAAGLTEADAPVATVVPFAAGSALFELELADDAGPAIPVRVRVDATAGAPLPVAVPTAPAWVRRLQRIALDGRGSTSPSGRPLRHRWSQVAGPWVALDDATSATPTFRPTEPGAYVFELEVQDGLVRSAPAAVRVDVQGLAPEVTE
jgi:DNA-binding beta-propeller fold protein YncE